MTVLTRGRPALRRAEVLRFVDHSIAETGVAPSYSMICDGVGIRTRQEVSRIVAALERVGDLRRTGRGRVRRITRPIFANSQAAAS